MITLDQIRLLEKKVHAAVAQISNLKHENSVLKEKLQSYEKRINELEGRIGEFKQDQSEIEQGILSALDQLDKLEDDVLESSGAEAEPQTTEQAPELGPAGSSEFQETPAVAERPDGEEPGGEQPEGGQPEGEKPADGDTDRPSEDSEERGELDIF